MEVSTTMSNYKKILVPFDFSEPSQVAVRHAVAIAGKYESSIDFLYVIEHLQQLGGTTANVERLEKDFRDAANGRLQEVRDSIEPPIETKQVVQVGKAAQAITDYAQENEVDLIVIGTRGHGKIDQALIGSVAERVVRSASCPVLTVGRGR